MSTDDPRLASDVSDFDFERSASASWQRFAQRLAEVLSVMDAGATLAIGAMAAEGAPPAYVTFTCEDGGALVARAHVRGVAGGAAEVLAGDGWLPDEPLSWRREGTQEDSLALATTASDALRTVFGVPHPALLAPDQLADILTPTPVEAVPGLTPPAEATGIMTGDRAELDRVLQRELGRVLGHEPIRDDDGDLAPRVGSTMVFVRPSPDGQEVLVFAALVHDVEGRSRAMEVLSDLNTEARWVRFLLIRDRVFVSLSVFANPLVPAHLHRALAIVSQIGDNIDDALAHKLRGRTTFGGEDAR